MSNKELEFSVIADTMALQSARIAELEKQIAELREQKESIEMDLVMQESINEENLKSIDERDAKIAEHPGQVEQAYNEGYDEGFHDYEHGSIHGTVRWKQEEGWLNSDAYARLRGEKG